MCSGCSGSYENPNLTAPEPEIDTHERETLQQFLQVHHVHCFSTSYLGWYLGIPQSNVERIAEVLIAEGAAFHPQWTDYIQGIEVDWAAVHAGRTAAPSWAGCEHKYLRWNGSRGEFRCEDCDEPQDVPELLEALGPEAQKPYDVFVEQ